MLWNGEIWAYEKKLLKKKKKQDKGTIVFVSLEQISLLRQKHKHYQVQIVVEMHSWIDFTMR